MREDDIQAHRVQRSPMQSTVVESVNTAVPSILEGPKTNALKDPRYDFGALKTYYAEWKPTNSQPGVSTRLKEGLELAWQQIQGAIDMFLSASPVARGVMNEMLAEYKILTSQLFITELTLYYEEIISKTGGGSPPTARRSRRHAGASSPSFSGPFLRRSTRCGGSPQRRCQSVLTL